MNLVTSYSEYRPDILFNCRISRQCFATGPWGIEVFVERAIIASSMTPHLDVGSELSHYVIGADWEKKHVMKTRLPRRGFRVAISIYFTPPDSYPHTRTRTRTYSTRNASKKESDVPTSLSAHVSLSQHSFDHLNQPTYSFRQPQPEYSVEETPRNAMLSNTG